MVVPGGGGLLFGGWVSRVALSPWAVGLGLAVSLLVCTVVSGWQGPGPRGTAELCTLSGGPAVTKTSSGFREGGFRSNGASHKLSNGTRTLWRSLSEALLPWQEVSRPRVCGSRTSDQAAPARAWEEP